MPAYRECSNGLGLQLTLITHHIVIIMRGVVASASCASTSGEVGFSICFVVLPGGCRPPEMHVEERLTPHERAQCANLIRRSSLALIADAENNDELSGEVEKDKTL